MYLKLNIDDVNLDLKDILKFFKNRYHLSDDWYKNKDGRLYEEIREHCEERVYLDSRHRKAYEIYLQIKDLYDLETKNRE